MKTSKAPLEKKRPLFFAAGLVFALSVTLVSFEWRTPYEIPVIPVGHTDIPDAPQGFVVTLPPPEKTVEKPELPKLEKKTPEIKIVPNETVVEKRPDVFTGEDLPDVEGKLEMTDEKEVDDIKPNDWVPKMPEYCSGAADMMKVLGRNLKYPEIPLNNGVSGVVVVQFIVSKSGAVQDAKVVRSVDPWLDAEALRVVKILDCFEPGQQGGRNVDVFLKLPVRFSID